MQLWHTHKQTRTHKPDQAIAQSLKHRNTVFNIHSVLMTLLKPPIYTDVNLHLIFSVSPATGFYTSELFYTSKIKAHNSLTETMAI